MPELKWIRVDDELPPDGEFVLVWRPSQDDEAPPFSVACRAIAYSEIRFGTNDPVPWWSDGSDLYEPWELDERPITHWARINGDFPVRESGSPPPSPPRPRGSRRSEWYARTAGSDSNAGGFDIREPKLLLVLVYEIQKHPKMGSDGIADLNVITPKLAEALLEIGHIGAIIEAPFA